MKVTSLNNNKIFIISPFAKDLFKPQNQINSNTTITSIPELVSIAENWSESTKKAFWALLNTDNLWQIFDVENNQLYLNFNVYPSGVGSFLDPRIYMPTTGWCKANLRRDRVSFSWKTRILNIQKPSLAPGMVGTTAVPNHDIYGNYFALSNVSLTNYKTTLNSPIFKMNDRTNSNVYYVSKYPNVPLYLDLHATQSNDPRLNLPQTILEQGEYFYVRIFNVRPFPISVRFWTRSVGATQTSPGSPTTMPVASYEQELSLDPNSVYFFIGQKAQDGSVGWIYTTDDIEGVSKKWKITADKVENNGVPLHLFEANDSGSFLPDNLSWTQLYQDTNLGVLVGTDLRNMFFLQDPTLRGPNGAILSSSVGSGGPGGSGLGWGVGIILVESASSGGGVGLTYFYSSSGGGVGLTYFY
ncbi:MAG: hypothetical protein EBR67_00800 [Proteobacteria bacterium]|nr:hypothetical protein [Pseudomonadota bacterium]